MLLVIYIVLLIAFSAGERVTKQQSRYPNRSSANAVDSHRRSIHASHQAVAAAPSLSFDLNDSINLRERQLDPGSDHMNYDLVDMQDRAKSLLRALEEVGSELFQELSLTDRSAEEVRLRNAVEANIAVVSLALDSITRILGTHDISDTDSDGIEDPKLKDFAFLLDSGEKEKRKLAARLMQLKKRWPPSISTNVPIDIISEENNMFGFRLRRLLPESLQRVHEYDIDQSSLALPPSLLGSGLLSDTGHEDVVFRQGGDTHDELSTLEEESQSVQEGHPATATNPTIQTDKEDPSDRLVGQPPASLIQEEEEEEHAFNSTLRLTSPHNTTQHAVDIQNSSAFSKSISVILCSFIMIMVVLPLS